MAYLLIIFLAICIVVPLMVWRDRRIARNAPYKPSPYTIGVREDRTQCEECGMALRVGETAYQTESFAHSYCSVACAKRAQTRPHRG